MTAWTRTATCSTPLGRCSSTAPHRTPPHMRRPSGLPSTVAYVVGSDNPSRNAVRTVLGFSEQANPAYFEEFVAAIGALHFGEQAQGPWCRCAPVQRRRKRAAASRGIRLPVSEARREELSERFAYLVAPGGLLPPAEPGAGGTSSRKASSCCCRRSSGRDLRMFPVVQTRARQLGGEPRGLQSGAGRDERPEIAKSRLGGAVRSSRCCPHVTRYFARLLRWVGRRHCAARPFTSMEPAQDDYSALYSFMSTVRADELDAVGARDFSGGQCARPPAPRLAARHGRTRTRTRGAASLPVGTLRLFHSAADQAGKPRSAPASRSATSRRP